VGLWNLSATFDGSHAEATTRNDNRYSTSSTAYTDMLAQAGGHAVADRRAALAARSGADGVEEHHQLLHQPADLWWPRDPPAGRPYGADHQGGLRLHRARQPQHLGTGSNLKRGDLSAGFNLAIPVTSRRENFGAALGDITLNISGGLDNLSDFGVITNWSGGATWGITPS
jgi:hypothetical protein